MAEILIEINKGSGTTTKNNAAKKLKAIKPTGSIHPAAKLTAKTPNTANTETAEKTSKTGVFVGNGGGTLNNETKKENSKMPLILGIAAAALLYFNSSKGSKKRK